jgi:group I intron endonuclease
MYYIYEIKNILDNKIYIGCHETDNVDDGYMGSGLILLLAMKKYGKENFQKTILEFCENKQKMFDKEKELVTEEFVKRLDTYNLNIGGHGGSIPGWKHTDEAKRKISEANYRRDPKSFSNPGWNHSQETKNKISEKLKGKQKTEEHRKKLSEANKGKKSSEETCKKLSEKSKGRKFSEETCKKLSEKLKGQKLSEDVKNKISETLKGHKLSEETKEKMRQAALKRYKKIREEKEVLYG